jgi:hypothetical protein
MRTDRSIRRPRKPNAWPAWSGDIDELPIGLAPPGWDRTSRCDDVEKVFADECWRAFEELDAKHADRPEISNFERNQNGSAKCPDL